MAKGTQQKTAYPTYWRQLKTVIGRNLRITINSVTDENGIARDFILRSQNSGKLVDKAAAGASSLFLGRRDTWPSGGILIKVKGTRLEGPVYVEYTWSTGKEANTETIFIDPTVQMSQLFASEQQILAANRNTVL